MTDWSLIRTIDWASDAGVVINCVLYSAQRPLLPEEIWRRSDRVLPVGYMRAALAGGLACGDLVLLDDGRVGRSDQIENVGDRYTDDSLVGWPMARQEEIEGKREEMQMFAAMAAEADPDTDWLEWKQCHDRAVMLTQEIKELEAKLASDIESTGFFDPPPEDTP